VCIDAHDKTVVNEQSIMTTLNLSRPTVAIVDGRMHRPSRLAFKRMRGRGAVPAAKLVVVGTSYRRPYDVGSRRLGPTS